MTLAGNRFAHYRIGALEFAARHLRGSLATTEGLTTTVAIFVYGISFSYCVGLCALIIALVYLYAEVAAQEEIEVQRVSDHGVDGGAGRDVFALADTVTVVGGHEPGVVSLLHDDESKGRLVRLVGRHLLAGKPDGAHLRLRTERDDRQGCEWPTERWENEGLFPGLDG